jgi:SPOR domain
MSKYYPEFYLRRKKQQQAYLRVTVVVAVIAIATLGIVAASYVFRAFIANRGARQGASTSMAQEQSDLKSEAKQDSASQVGFSGIGGDAQPDEVADVKLADIEYSESFPSLSIQPVGLEAGGLPGEAEPGNELPPSGEPTTADSVPSESGESTDDPQSGAESTAPRDVDASGEQAAADQAATDAAAKKEVDAAKEAKRKKDEKERLAKEKAKRDAEDKSKAEAKNEAKDTVSPTPQGDSGKSGTVRYRVYAGKFLSEAEAKDGKANLSALGLAGSAQIIDTKAGDYLLLVTVLDGLDEATALRNKLSGGGFSGAFVTRKTDK